MSFSCAVDVQLVRAPMMQSSLNSSIGVAGNPRSGQPLACQVRITEAYLLYACMSECHLGQRRSLLTVN